MDSFSNIIGHEAAIERLRLALEHGAFPQAALLTGRRHLGKGALAIAAASALLGAAAADSHPDFRMIVRQRDAKTDKLRKNLSIDEIRELREFLQLSPLVGGWKAAIIDEVETLSEEAANALLKILEEPPPSSHVILVAHDLSRVLPTIRSRSALFSLGRVSEETILRALASKGIDADLARRVVAYADGRPGAALALCADSDMLDWYAGEARRWGSLQDAPLYRRFSLVAGLAPNGADREETLHRLRDVISFWETSLRRDLLAGSPSAPRRIRELGRLRRSLDANVQPRLLLERFVLTF